MILSPIIQFVLTIVPEFFVVWFFIKKNVKTVLLYTFLINLFSWPLAAFIALFGLNILIIEAGVVLVESILIMLLFKVKYPRSLLISFAANLVSFVLGYIIYSYL